MELRSSPARVARVAVRRYVDGWSFERIAHEFACEGPVRATTLRTWLETTTDQLAPLLDAMWAEAARQTYLACDVVLVDARELWWLATPSDQVLTTHDFARVRAMLHEFEGFLVSDSAIVDEHLDRHIAAHHPWVTTRRAFLHALDSDPELARTALTKIRAITRSMLELGVANAEPPLRRQLVEQCCQPLVADFLAWCFARVSPRPGQGIHPALRHVFHHRDELESFFRQARDQLVPRPRPHILDRELGSTFMTLCASCRLHELEPERYLCDLLLLWPSWPRQRVHELAPATWRSVWSP